MFISAEQLVGHLVEGVADELLEALAAHLDRHAPIVPVEDARPAVEHRRIACHGTRSRVGEAPWSSGRGDRLRTKRGVEGDLGAGREQPGDRAVRLGALGDLLELARRRCPARRRRCPGRSGSRSCRRRSCPGAPWRWSRPRSGVNPASARRLGERHREAAGVRGADQLLGVGALALLEAGLERVVPLVAALAGADACRNPR